LNGQCRTRSLPNLAIEILSRGDELMRRSNALLSLVLCYAWAQPVAAQSPESEQIERYTSGSFAQVNSVSELSDVDPNSWGFQALKSVVERYGCLEGTPERTYLGNRPLTRYEFAAGLAACLERVNDLVRASTAGKASREDLATLERLQLEYGSELATLRGRTDALEAKVRDTEAKLFSTTAKLDGSVVMAVTGGGSDSNGTVTTPVSAGSAFGDSPFTRTLGGGVRTTSGAAAATSFTARTTLNLRASFTGNDELLIRLRGVTGQDLGAAYRGIAGGRGTNFAALGPDNRSYDGSTASGATNGAATVTIDKLRYVTNLFGDDLRVFIGPRIELFEFIDTNSFANNPEIDFTNGLMINNPLITYLFAGPGGGFDWQVNDWFAARVAYIAAEGGATTGSGLFGGSYQLTAELEFNPSRSSAIKLQYAHLYEQGSLLGTALEGRATAGVTDALGVNAEWAITPTLAVFGRFGYGFSGLSAQVSGVDFAQITTTTWQLGFALPNLFGPGNTFAVAYGQPLRAGEGRLDGLSLVPSATEGDLEAFWRIGLSDRLTLTPNFQYYFNAANASTSSGIAVGTLRATFTF
jgi:hypothetical protein